MPTISEVENLSAAELKAKAAELAEAVKDEPSLAARYVQARADAKLRDEKLAEQGRTIQLLQEALETTKAQFANEKVTEAALVKSLDEKTRQLDQFQSDVAQQLEHLEAALQHERQRAARLKQQAEKFQACVSATHKLTLDAINAAAVAQADQGE